MALNNKVNYKECMVEDAEREKSNLFKENLNLTKKVEEMKSLHSVIQMLEKQSSDDTILGVPSAGGVGGSVRWATTVRQTQPIDQQANIFYESFRIILVKEDAYKSRIQTLKNENEKLNNSKMVLESEYAFVKKRCQNLIEKNKRYK